MERQYPVVWVIGATRSCKSALAEYGVAPLGFRLIATGNYFRGRFGKEDTYSREFVFELSAFAAECLSRAPDCHLGHLEKFIAESDQPCVIEGERNPSEFAKLYDPRQDMVIMLQRVNMDVYDTVIERGIAAIEQIVRCNVNAGIAPRASAVKATFGDNRIRAEYLGAGNREGEVFIEGPVKDRKTGGTEEEKYPWINILIGLTRECIRDYYGDKIRPPASSPQNRLLPAPIK